MFRNYLAACLRNLGRNRVHAAATIISLSLGFTAALLVAIFVQDQLTYDRFWQDGDRLFLVNVTSKDGTTTRSSDAAPVALAPLVTEAVPQVEAVTRVSMDRRVLTRGQESHEETALLWADPNVFEVLKLRRVRGDLATALTRPDTVVLTESLARRYFGDTDPVGKTIVATQSKASGMGKSGPDQTLTVTGVVEDVPIQSHIAASAFVSNVSAVSPLSDGSLKKAFTYIRLDSSGSRPEVDARLAELAQRHFADETTIPKIRLRPIAMAHMGDMPKAPPKAGGAKNSSSFSTGVTMFDMSMKPSGRGANISAFIILGGVILLAASINFVTLLSARASIRAVEVGVRKTSGAKRSHLLTQFVGEAVVYALIALLISIALSEVGVQLINRFSGREIDFDYLEDWLFGLALVGAALGLGVLGGLYPALVLSSFRPSVVLKGGPVRTPGAALVRQILVVVQFLPVIVLALFAIGIHRQGEAVIDRATGQVGEHVLLVSEPCSPAFLEAVRKTEGVAGAACTPIMTMNGLYVPMWEFGSPSQVLTPNGQRVTASVLQAGFGAFELTGLTAVAGRLLSPAYGEDRLFADLPPIKGEGESVRIELNRPELKSNPSVLINESAVRRLGFDSPQAAIGKSVSWAQAEGLPLLPSTIVGVVKDRTMMPLQPAEPGIFYVPTAGMPGIVVKLTGRDVRLTVRRLEQAKQRVLGGKAMQSSFYGDAVRSMMSFITIVVAVLLGFVGLGLLIALLGMFALSAFAADRRTKEIGIRRAMGASTTQVMRLMVWQFSQPVLVAVLIACPLAWLGITAAMQALPPAERATVGPLSFLLVGAGALLVSWATTFSHAWRVARANPSRALRYE